MNIIIPVFLFTLQIVRIISIAKAIYPSRFKNNVTKRKNVSDHHSIQIPLSIPSKPCWNKFTFRGR